MRKPNDFSTNFGDSATNSGGGWAGLFRRIHPVKTAECVAAEIGAPVRSVENWIAGTAQPSLRWLRALARAYGWPVLMACFPGLPCLSEAAHQARLAEAQAAVSRAEAALESLRAVRP